MIAVTNSGYQNKEVLQTLEILSKLSKTRVTFFTSTKFLPSLAIFYSSFRRRLCSRI